MKRILIILLLFFAGLCLTSFASMLIQMAFGSQTRDCLLCQSAAQCLLAFALPAWLAARQMDPSDPARFLAISNPSGWKAIIGVVILFIIAQPAMNQLILWNAEMHLPDSLSEVEKIIREWEEMGEATTSKILGDYSIWGLISGVLVVGVLTGCCEEIFFRGTLQNALSKVGLSPGLAIWTTAFIFSAIHFQFFGFAPRLLMGAAFGYLLVWSGSLRTSAFAHSLNNSLVVIFSWIAGRCQMNGSETFNSFENLGTVEAGIPWPAVGSAVATALFLYFFRKYFFFKSSNLH